MRLDLLQSKNNMVNIRQYFTGQNYFHTCCSAVSSFSQPIAGGSTGSPQYRGPLAGTWADRQRQDIIGKLNRALGGGAQLQHKVSLSRTWAGQELINKAAKAQPSVVGSTGSQQHSATLAGNSEIWRQVLNRSLGAQLKPTTQSSFGRQLRNMAAKAKPTAGGATGSPQYRVSLAGRLPENRATLTLFEMKVRLLSCARRIG